MFLRSEPRGRHRHEACVSSGWVVGRDRIPFLIKAKDKPCGSESNVAPAEIYGEGNVTSFVISYESLQVEKELKDTRRRGKT